MKKNLIFCLIFLVLLSVKAVAHSPSYISINYDTDVKYLVVNISHSVSNPNTHYIENITIEKNNQFYKGFDYTSQPSSSSFTYNYSGIIGESGDMFSVIAYCNQGGKISKNLTVGSTVNDTSTPGFELIILICAIAFILFFKQRNKICK